MGGRERTGLAPDVVLLDFGGTLDADGLPWSARFHHAYRARGGALTLRAFEALFRDSDRQLAALAGVHTLGFRAMLEAQGRVLAPLLPDGAAVDLRLVVAAVHADALATVARNRGVLDALRGEVRLGIVSNFTGNLERCLDELELRHYFDVVLDSAVVGVAKPARAIYALALARLGVAPARALMVGDNPWADVRPANELGLATCWLAPPERPTPHGCVPTARIAHLPELLAVLGRAAVPTRAAAAELPAAARPHPTDGACTG